MENTELWDFTFEIFAGRSRPARWFSYHSCLFCLFLMLFYCGKSHII